MSEGQHHDCSGASIPAMTHTIVPSHGLQLSDVIWGNKPQRLPSATSD